MSYCNVASIFFVNLDGKLILQKRDDKPGIRNPNLITAWGGECENGETPLQAALREVREETNLEPKAADLKFYKKYPRDYEIKGKQVVNHVFVLQNVDEHGLEVFEGQGYVLIDPEKNEQQEFYAPLTHEFIADYYS